MSSVRSPPWKLGCLGLDRDLYFTSMLAVGARRPVNEQRVVCFACSSLPKTEKKTITQTCVQYISILMHAQ